MRRRRIFVQEEELEIVRSRYGTSNRTYVYIINDERVRWLLLRVINQLSVV